MNHKVNSVANLHADAKALFDNDVVGSGDFSADTIIFNLAEGIRILKDTWKGKDAGVQIENVIVVHNAMVGIRNVLAELCVSSSKIAANYRDIQNSNGAGLEQLTVLNYTEKTRLEDYSDNRDTVDIVPGAKEGKTRIDNANNNLPTFIEEVKKYYGAIMDNWTVGTGRENAQQAFNEFLSKSKSYEETLNSVSASIATALENYVFGSGN